MEKIKIVIHNSIIIKNSNNLNLNTQNLLIKKTLSITKCLTLPKFNSKINADFYAFLVYRIICCLDTRFKQNMKIALIKF